MPDGLSAAGPASTGPLAATLVRVGELADKLGLCRDEVFSLQQLSAQSGVPVGVVKALLEGREAGEPDLQTRFLQRFDLLRRTRLKPDGRRYTQQEIACGAGMSRQQAGALINGDRRPTMEHCDAIQRFFQVHAGFLTASDADALDGALQRTEQELLQRLAAEERGTSQGELCESDDVPVEDPLQRLLLDHGVRGIAWRAAQLPTDKHRDTVTEWLDMLLENVRRSDPAPGPESKPGPEPEPESES
ncbi:helix-turn-helix domain-containing protein [Streptomyces apocyni]|uniref:helix-turn-helix domain-containing protein n=1 Tax=Streptomyces apocyni TaxID=2654677 RepID=UPI0012E99865|nr:helix-turn-helix transcriptional regulator [Streptomyces apocyni]